MLTPKVLLVNDDPASLFALESLLTAEATRLDYELLTAASGREALRQVLLHDFAVILLDVSMPGMDGFETAAAIHSHPRAHTVPIIFITAHFADEINRLKAYQSGAADYLFTPIVPQVLQSKVAIFVELAKKNLLLQIKSQQLARLNQDLRTQRLQDLERSNSELQLEVAERKLAEQRAHELSIRDPLTGLLNRRALVEQLEHAVATSDRQRGAFALLFLDLDKFKSINDSLGHDVGDELLRQVAARLTASVRVSDVVARLGGDEFVVLVEGKGGAAGAGAAAAVAADAARVAKKISLAHSRPFEIGVHKIRTSASVGIGLYPDDGASAQQLMKHADLAMYHAKQAQRGSIQFFHEALNVQEKERDLWRAELREALRGGQFELAWQPRVGVADGAVAAFEATLRWSHPRLGAIDAADFLPAVPDRALLEQIDDWAIAAACAQAALWAASWPALRADIAALPPQPRVAVNLAAQRLAPELPQKIAALLRRHKLAPGSIELELPEALLCQPVELVGPVLRALRAAGVAISVDDFGSAGAALATCQSLALDALKLDRAFVRAIAAEQCHHSGGERCERCAEREQALPDARGADMAGAIVLLAHALSLKAVALGVGSAAQLAMLARLGCDEYQGELFCPPLPASQLMPRLREQLARMHGGGDDNKQPPSQQQEEIGR